jgi:hypothetical protein
LKLANLKKFEVALGVALLLSMPLGIWKEIELLIDFIKFLVNIF